MGNDCSAPDTKDTTKGTKGLDAAAKATGNEDLKDASKKAKSADKVAKSGEKLAQAAEDGDVAGAAKQGQVIGAEGEKNA